MHPQQQYINPQQSQRFYQPQPQAQQRYAQPQQAHIIHGINNLNIAQMISAQQQQQQIQPQQQQQQTAYIHADYQQGNYQPIIQNQLYYKNNN
jgi:hypothetical protein